MRIWGMPRRLSHKLLLGLGAGMLLSSLIFLVIFVESYRSRLQDERVNASEQVNRLFQFSLENAMLKRDLPGLRDIITRLGQQPGILNVQIVNPQLEVRFATQDAALGSQVTLQDLGCTDCASGVPALAVTSWLHTINGKTVLRSVNPIRNKPECKQCHGPADQSPVNGILIVDHEANGIRTQALLAAAGMAGAGITVELIILIGTWIFLRREVLKPVNALDSASQALAAGDLAARVPERAAGRDELGALCHTFNSMAGRIQEGVKEIQAKEAFLKALIETVPDGMRVIDENYNVVMVNKAYAAQMQAAPEALIGVPCYRAQGRHEPCPPTLITCPFHALNADGQSLKYVHRHIRTDGDELFTEITAARLTLDDGDGKKHTLVIEAVRNLTEQVRYSQEQRLAEIGQLATGVAHEIYNPLASVRVGLQSIMRKNPDGEGLDPDTYYYLRVIDTEMDKCIEITKRLLDLSHLPSHNTQLVSFSVIVPEVVSLLRYEAEHVGVEMIIDMGRSDLRVFATDSDMRMLTLNLAQNAIHAMPSGGRLTIRGRIEDGNVIIEATDTGAGIAAADLVHIFDPFFSKRADGIEGTGLGLTICKAIVARHGGMIKVESTAGQGATFRVIMPYAGGMGT